MSSIEYLTSFLYKQYASTKNRLQQDNNNQKKWNK